MFQNQGARHFSWLGRLLMPTTAGAYQRALKRFKRRGMMLSESRLSLQCKAQTSGAFFPESYFPEIAGILVGVFLYLVERDRRHLPRCARHILRRQRENEGSGIGRPGAVDHAELAADVAFYIEQFKSLRRGDQGKHRPQGTSPAFSIFDPAGTWAWRSGPVDAVAVR